MRTKGTKAIWKPVSALLLSLALAVGAIGCSSGGGNPKPESSGETKPGETPAPKKDPVKIVFWHYLNDRKALMESMAKEFAAKTGVEVDVQLFGGDGFKEKVVAAAQTKSLPDIMTFAGGEGDLAKLIQTNSVMELGSEKKELMTKFPQNLLDKYTYKQGNIYDVTKYGTYALPLDTNNMQFMYNKDLFAKAGIAGPPKTWKEFLDAIDKLVAAGIPPLATGIGSWVSGPMIEPYLFAYLGKEKLIETKQGKQPMIGSEWENALGLYEELYAHKAFVEGISTMDLPKAEELFANGKAAILFDGSWGIGVLDQMNKSFKNYGVFAPPKDERAKYDIKIPGGVGAPLVVSADTKHKKETLDFLEFLLSKEQQERYAKESFNLPANKEAATGTLTEAMAQFAKGAELVYDTPGSFTPGVDAILSKGIQLIVLGQAKAKDIVRQMDEATQKNIKAGKTK